MSWRTWLDRVLGPSLETADVLDAAARVGSGFSRRQFLRTALVGAAVAATVDVEQLLWMPGEKTILLPELVPCWSDEQIDWFTRHSLDIMNKNLAIAAKFNRQYDQKFRVGDTLIVRIPRRFEPYDYSGKVADIVPVTLVDGFIR